LRCGPRLLLPLLSLLSLSLLLSQLAIPACAAAAAAGATAAGAGTAGASSAGPGAPGMEVRASRVRQGFLLGANLGFAAAEFSMDSAGSTVSTGWSGGGKTGRVRLGYAPTPELIVSLEYGVWRRAPGGSTSAASATSSTGTDSGTATSSSGLDVERYLGIGMASVTLYPRASGFFLRGGAGYGSAWALLDTATGARASGKGLAVVIGLGYDLWADDDLAIGIQFDYGFLNGSNSLQGNFAQLTAAASVYVPGF
jgi:hypothetical protein